MTPRRRVVSARLTDSEKATVEAAADINDVSPSEFARRSILGLARLVVEDSDLQGAGKEAADEAADEARAKFAEARATGEEEHSE